MRTGCFKCFGYDWRDCVYHNKILSRVAPESGDDNRLRQRCAMRLEIG